MPNLSLSLLGPFAATLDQRPITRFRTKNAQALLIYLVCESDHPLSRDWLVGLFWPELPQSSSQKRLRDALYWLRKTIPEVTSSSGSEPVPLLLADRNAVQVNPAAAYELDTDRFNQLLNQDIAEWPAAIDLYRGDFLADFYLPDSNKFEEWVSVRRAELRRQMLQALDVLTSLALHSGDLAAAEAYARRQLDLDDLRESAHRQMMESLAGRGRRRAALSHYETVRQLLGQELGIEPSAETLALYQAIRSDEFNGNIDVKEQRATPLPHEEGIEQVQTQPGPPHNLPAQSTPFIGREQELAELQALLAEPQTRLITIVGPGGMGKTRLALACAEGQLRSGALGEHKIHPYNHGLFFVDLAPLDDVDQIVPTLAQVFNFPLQGGERERRTPRQQILDYLRRKRMLLILDNFEHLLDGVDLVTDILGTAPGVQILVTSRERLQLRQEQAYPIQGLEIPDWETPEDAAEFTAVRLFLQSARRVRPAFDLAGGDNLRYLARICRLVSGMPLAIELAAAWVDMASLETIAVEIGNSLDFLEVEMRDVPLRHRSIRAVFDTSWWRLSEVEQQLFQVLSVFRGGFTRKAALEVTGATLRSLARLVNKSLLRYNEAHDRYQMHDLLRQYAAEKLVLDSDKEFAARDGHSAYYCQALARWEKDLKGARQLAALAEMAADIDNAWAAWRWTVDHFKTKRLAQAVDGLCLFYDMRYRFQEGERACRLALEKLAELKTEDTDGLRLQARVLAWQGLFVRWRRSTKQAHQLWGQSLALLEKPELAGLDTRPERAFILMLSGEHSTVDASIGVEVAIEVAEESLALYRELGDRWGMARALSAMGDLILHKVNPGQAKPFLEESLAIRQALGDQWGVADSLSGLSWVFGTQGQLAEGERLGRESLAIYREIGDQRSVGLGLGHIGGFLVYQGRFAEAKPLAEEYLAISDDLGSDRFIAWANSLAGFPDLYLGAYAEAKAQAQRGLALSREIDFE